MNAFSYPLHPHQRRHGPQGYLDYESYRPWLRDEFEFRCVYCLRREQWDRLVAIQIDHFDPVNRLDDELPAYDNLLYACIRCNQAKGSQSVADPTAILLQETVTIGPDGQITSSSAEAKTLIAALDLNGAEVVNFRRTWMELLALAQRFQPSLYQQLRGYPENLPNLESLRPPQGNSRPEGIAESCYAKRQRNELPETY